MKCPKCQRENESTAKVCAYCGAPLQNDAVAANGEKALAGAVVLGKEAREKRLKEAVDPSAIISVKMYNGLIGGVLLWGLLINYLLCWKVGSYTTLFPKMSPVAFLIGYAVVAFIGIFVTSQAKTPAVSFLGFNLVVLPFGLVISTIVQSYGGIESTVVTQAFLYTLLICAAILATAIVFPKAFSKLGGMLGAVLFGLILCEVVLMIFRVRQQWTSWIAAVVFSLYLGYDIYRSQQFPKTVKNAIASAMDIYLDIANLFIRLLRILGKKD